MKEITNVQRATNYLVKIFKAVNEDYFEGKLETPSITVMSTIGAYGHISTSKVWSNGETASYELNLGAEYLTRDISEVATTMIHECVHLYCLMNGIKDTSNRGIYHNASGFKRIAEEKGHLIVERHEKYGWTITSPSEETIDFCIRHGFEDIKICRNTGLSFFGGKGVSTPEDNDKGAQPTPKIKKGNSRRYVCPQCGTIIRATREVNVVCGDCNIPFELTE